MIILTERPEGMSYEKYKAHLKSQKRWIRNHLKGTFYYVSSDIFYSKEDPDHLFGMRTTYPPFRGQMKLLTKPIAHN